LSEDLLDKDWGYLKSKTLYHKMYIRSLDSVVYLGFFEEPYIMLYQILENSMNLNNREVIA